MRTAARHNLVEFAEACRREAKDWTGRQRFASNPVQKPDTWRVKCLIQNGRHYGSEDLLKLM